MVSGWKRKLIAGVQRTRVRFPFLSLTSLKAAYRFAQMVEIVRILRGPYGCAWDRKQQLADFLPFLKEEALESWIAGQEALAGEHEHFAEELGDLHFVMLFLARLCQEEGQFDIADSLASIVAKMVRRHPHVFADAPRDQASIKRTWQKIKAEEKRVAREKKGLPPTDTKPPSILNGALDSWSALHNALDISKRVVKVGFEWPNAWDVWNKVEEELEELKEVMPPKNQPEIQDAHSLQRQREELGDLLFTLVNLGRHLGIDCEEALHEQCLRFTGRFQFIEERLNQRGERLEDTPLDALEELWQEAKLERA